ncbi:MAG: pilus assembly protein [Planctomycetes bacterium]|nr:pilus assembly protein [Planctomycetota bacterium]
MKRCPLPHRDPESGQAMTEFMIVFPLWLLMTMGIMQLGMIFGAQQIVHYAAFTAARSELVKGDTDTTDVTPETAARLTCLPLAGPLISGSAKKMKSVIDYELEALPMGFVGQLLGFKTQLKISGDKKKVTAEVTRHFELVMPIVNVVFVKAFSLGLGALVDDQRDPSSFLSLNLENTAVTALYGSPHIVIRETTSLPRPWGEEDFKDEPNSN